MIGTPTFASPPVVELVIGAQFSPLTKLTAGHFGLIWNALGSEWIEPADGPVLNEAFEIFDRPSLKTPPGVQLHLRPARLPGRLLLGHRSNDRRLQIQSTRFHFNWRRGKDFYPSYKTLIAEFESTFSRFVNSVEQLGLGPVELNQWEITYIDSFPRDEYWNSPSDWSRLLPGLFGPLFNADDLNLKLEQRLAEWSYEISPRRGRLHARARSGQWGPDARDTLLLEWTARGPLGVQGAATLREGLDLGHDVAVGAFLKVVDPGLLDRWRKGE
jgi:uncharacterized protein (TIGR04255 family)